MHSFQADTILIPKASVPNASAYENITSPLLYSIVLKNGGEAEFEAYMESLGYGGSFAYFNQGYNALANTLSVISANALRLLLMGCSVFLLAMSLFLFLNFRRMRTVVRGMRLLGVKATAVWLEQFQTMATLIFISVILGLSLIHILPEQVQDFYPTPSTLSTVMYCTGLDPRTMEPVFVPRTPHEKAMQRALIQYRDPKNQKLVYEALHLAGREDLIGTGPKCLIRPPKAAAQPASKRRTAAKGRR